MKKKLKSRGVLLLVGLFVVVGLAIGGFALYGNYQMSKIPKLSYQDVLAYTLKDNKDAVITVGIVKDGESEYAVYGKNGKRLPLKEHIYEIGSLTKTFTAALIDQAINEEKIHLDDTLDKYLSLDEQNNYPTIKQLLTHTSGYKPYYFETPMVGNFFTRKNSFNEVSDEQVMHRLSKLSVNDGPHDFNYSNFGFATLGLVLEAVYDEEYSVLVEQFAQEKLGLSQTQISDQKGDLGHYWDWQKGDAYLSAGGLTSTITDMLDYAQLQLSENATEHMPLASIKTTSARNKRMGIHMDEAGMSWMIDKKNEIVWHNGGTGDYNCYLGFNPKTKTAVVVLSNLSPNSRIPATILGIKRLEELNR